VVAVFRQITGEDEQTAFMRFFRHLTGDAGISVDALAACLKDAGWTLTRHEQARRQVAGSDDPLDEEAFTAFWSDFRGEGVIFYRRDEATIGHTVFVQAAGIVLDPQPSAPEEGEFIVDYFKRVGGRITLTSVSTVTRSAPP
jgi:hypothetical protein